MRSDRSLDVDLLVQIYLGGDVDGNGIRPYGTTERLRKHCADDFEACRALVERLVAKTLSFPIPADTDLVRIAEAVSRWLESEEPALRPSTRRMLANYYAYTLR